MDDHVLPSAPPKRAGRREWVGLAVLALPTLLLSIDVSVLYLALPALSDALGADATQQLWILDIYSFLLAGLLVTMGNLGDRIGRRRLLLIGGSVFAVASFIAAFSVSTEMLIIARALLGVAGATLAPSTMALIRNLFTDPQQLGTAISIWLTCFMGGMLIGPIVGGLLLQHFWWGSTFLIAVPVMIMLVVLGPKFLPEYRAAEPGRLDLWSVALVLAAVLPSIWGLKELARLGMTATALAAIVVGLVMGLEFVRRQQRLADPMLDLGLFGNRVFATSLGMLMITGVVMAGFSLLIALYLQSVLGLAPLAAGLWLLPQSIAMIIGFQLAPLLARRFPSAVIASAGLGLGAVGFAVATQTGSAEGPSVVITGFVLACFGLSFPMTLLTSLMLAAAPPDKAGSAAAVNETSSELGIALGIACIGSLVNAVYRVRLGAELPSTIPADATHAASDGIAGALTAADELPPQLAAQLLSVARASFTSGVSVAALVGVLVFATLAALTAVLLREPSHPEPSVTVPTHQPIGDHR